MTQAAPAAVNAATAYLQKLASRRRAIALAGVGFCLANNTLVYVSAS